MKKTLALVLALLLVVALVPASVASAEWKPTSTVSIIIPAGAGGDTDLTARVFAQYAKEMTGVDFIVVNASGAAGSIAANQVLSAAPDGLTVLYGHNLVNVANVAGVTDYNYTAFKLGPTFAKNPANQLFVNPEKYDSLEAFIEAAKANPGKLKACTEVGAYTYYLILAFEKAAGIDLDIVDDLIKDIPTFKEQGIDLVFPDCDYSFYFPKETPDEVIAWYDALVEEMEQNQDCLDAISAITVIPYYLNSADSEKNDEAYFNTFTEIAASLEG